MTYVLGAEHPDAAQELQHNVHLRIGPPCHDAASDLYGKYCKVRSTLRNVCLPRGKGFQSGGTQTRRRLNSLTGLRFFAALAIFFIHVVYFIPPLAFLQSSVAKAFLPACSAGVCLFFLLSGFLLAYAHSEMSLTSSSLYKFWTSRIARIYPVYFLALVLYAPYILAHRFFAEPTAIAVKKSLAAFVPSVLLVQSWGLPRFAIAWNGPGWRLSVEAALYLAFPWITHCFAKRTQRSLLVIIGSLMILSLCLSIGVPRLLSGCANIDLFVNFNPLFHLPTFGIGIALGCHFLHSNTEHGKNQWLALLGIVSIALFALVAPKIPPLITHNCLFLPPFAALIYGLAGGGRLSDLIALPFFVLLGEASYSFYILQFPLGSTFRWLNETHPAVDMLAAPPGAGLITGIDSILACIGFLLCMSIFVYRGVEVPSRRLLLGLLQSRPAQSSALDQLIERQAPR